MAGSRSAQPPQEFRTLADQLRAWPEAKLARLLTLRPDLATPAPSDSSQLASRASVSASISRALDQLTSGELSVLDALVVLGRTSQPELTAAVNADPAFVGDAVTLLVDLALIWNGPGGLRPVRALAETWRPGSPGSSGVQPRSPEPGLAADIDAALAGLSDPARALIAHLDENGGVGVSSAARRTVSRNDASTPTEELLAAGLIRARDNDSLVVPGEVALRLRDGRTTRQPVDSQPALVTTERPRALVDRAASGAAFETVRRVELLLDAWGSHPPRVLKTGGLGVRDLKAAATLLQVDTSSAALIVELAAEAGLVAPGLDPDSDLAWMPTDRFDSWTDLAADKRWLVLAETWLATERAPALADTRDGTGKPINALTPDVTARSMAETRQMTLTALGELPSGQVLATGTGGASLVRRLTWQRPRRSSARLRQIEWALTEGATLGLVALGGLASYAAALLDRRVDTATATLAELLPEPVDHVLIQADLTAVAPGPLTAEVAHSLHLIADVESRGGATVYRFSTESVRRALDHGWTAGQVHEFLAATSRTPVPQPLTYLVDDTARTFGRVRIGHAEAFVRADEDTLTELLHHPKAPSLRLRRIAPTVVVTDLPLDLLLPRLRDVGAAPVVEAADGTVQVARPDLMRSRASTGRPAQAQRSVRDQAQVSKVVAAVRAGDRAVASGASRAVASGAPAMVLAALREAAEARNRVLIGYVDGAGRATERMVDPQRVDGGQLTAYDLRSDGVLTFAIHRITAVRPSAG